MAETSVIVVCHCCIFYSILDIVFCRLQMYQMSECVSDSGEAVVKEGIVQIYISELQKKSVIVVFVFSAQFDTRITHFPRI